MAGMTDYPGVEWPARAEVLSSAADERGYRATLEILDGAGERTGQVLPDMPLPRVWLPRDGAGQYGPPAAGVVLSVTWQGGSAGHPVVQGAAEVEPHAPAAAVPEGAWAHQDGEGSELRQGADGSWTMRNRDGAQVAIDVPGLVRIASTAESLRPVLDALLDALIAAMTEISTTTDSAGHTGPVPKLPFDGATLAALAEVKARLALVLRP